jgi:hypothetical protein
LSYAKIQIPRHHGGDIFGDNDMIRSWIHTNLTLLSLSASRDERFGCGLQAWVCSRLEAMNYQLAASGSDLPETTS